jgi:hypothetical protein
VTKPERRRKSQASQSRVPQTRPFCLVAGDEHVEALLNRNQQESTCGDVGWLTLCVGSLGASCNLAWREPGPFDKQTQVFHAKTIMGSRGRDFGDPQPRDAQGPRPKGPE